MGNTITSLKGLQKDRNMPAKAPKIVISDRQVSPIKEDLPKQEKVGRSSINMVQTVLVVILIILNIALVVTLKTRSSETGKFSAQIKAMDKDIRAQINASAAVAKEIDIMRKAQIDQLSKTINVLSGKVNSLETSLKTDYRP